MSLKDLTWEHHKNAERQEFVKVLRISEKNWFDKLYLASFFK